MGKRGGQLLWNRKRLILPPGLTDVDTSVCAPSYGFSHGQPVLDGRDPTQQNPSGVPSRLMVIPQQNYADWANIMNFEPYVDATTKTAHVVFINGNQAGVEVDCLFWDPSSKLSPGMADTYLPYIPRPPQGPGNV